MDRPWYHTVESHLGAAVIRVEPLQSLWSGYGEIVRLHLQEIPSIIVKRVLPPMADPADRGHARKLRSYDVELAFYRHLQPRCGPDCRVAHLHYAERDESPPRWLIALEDLDASGFAGRRGYERSVTDEGLAACLDWLAYFHATFLDTAPDGLWQVGSYWHLDTRPDELRTMADGPLKQAAVALDTALQRASNRTLVHGDAKLANFCFAEEGPTPSVAAVDFQYVGGGVGVRDVAYLIGGARREPTLSREAEHWHDHYFASLQRALHKAGHGTRAADIEHEWRALLPIAWADFERFLAGWAPHHWKRSDYAQRQVDRALSML